jgi:translation initiation factor 1 (eIF-1/SUI1)
MHLSHGNPGKHRQQMPFESVNSCDDGKLKIGAMRRKRTKRLFMIEARNRIELKILRKLAKELKKSYHNWHVPFLSLHVNKLQARTFKVLY